jgi:hypothetical protein
LSVASKLVLAGKSKREIVYAIELAIKDKELPDLESEAMCYMMLKHQYLSDQAKRSALDVLRWRRRDKELGSQSTRLAGYHRKRSGRTCDDLPRLGRSLVRWNTSSANVVRWNRENRWQLRLPCFRKFN